MEKKQSDFILFKTEDEKISVDVRFEDDTVWLTQDQIALLFGKAKSTINEHLQNIFTEGELEEASCLQKFGISEFQQKAPYYYNLDVIISVGYRVRSMRGTQFRQWATKRLNEYIRKGFAMDDERLKSPNNLFGKDYFEEQLSSKVPVRNPKGVTRGSLKVKRGGAFNSKALDCRIDHRAYAIAISGKKDKGFRVVLEN